MTNKLVSILIPVYNAENWLEETIQSALNQAWDNTEIIIVDDGSTDNSPEIARSFASDKVQVISQKNAGAAAARNRAFAASKGNYIQYLDADDLLAPDKIEKQMLRLQKESETTVASGPFDYFTGEPDNKITKDDNAYRDYKNPLDWLVESMQKQDMFPPLVWLTPRRLIEEAGPWNEQLSYNDDPEFFARVLLKADKIAFCEDAKSYYRRGISSSLGSRKDEKALASRLLALQLVTEYMLEAENTQRVREGCGFAFRKYIYSLYPQFPALRKEAQETLKRLDVDGRYDFASGKSATLGQWFGWKTVKWLRFFYHKLGYAG